MSAAPSEQPAAAGESEGIRLEPFSEANADLVLSWRNSERVRANSLDPRAIPREAHLAFIRSIPARKRRGYWLLSLEGRPEAVFNVDASAGAGSDAEAEAFWGCYIGDADAPRPGLFPLLAVLAGLIAFERFGCQVLRSDVLSHNEAPQKMNAFLGIAQSGERLVAVPDQPEGGGARVLEYRLERADWAAMRAKADRLMTRRLRGWIEALDLGLLLPDQS